MPREWLKYVFASLGSFLGKKKILTISILGIQSSGKSTFLNAMYGANFAVSVGRCTSGVSMKILPVNQSRNKQPYDYLAILDTEGLRAPELIDDPQRDNELALLAVGLSNLSLVNIKGESIAEMKDILQIVVHASLRMKLANRNKSKCLFVSQNVSAHNAKQKMKEGLQKTVEQLDEMTEEAADLEKIGSITSFNQVLDFDMNSNVFYIPDLWNGIPPMAAVSQEYCKKTKNVVDFIIKEMQNIEQGHFLSSDKLFEKIEDLWNAILSENFVFSFKNSLQVKSYDDLELKVSELIRNFERALNGERREKETNMDKLLTDELDSGLLKLIQELKSAFINEGITLQNELQLFFDNHTNKAILEEYRLNHIQIVDQRLNKIIEDQIEKLVEYKKNKDIVSESMRFLSEFSTKIIKQSTLAAKEYEGLDSICKNQLRQHFDSLWQDELAKLNLDTRIQTNEDRTNMANNFLSDHFRRIHSKDVKKHERLLKDRLEEFEELKKAIIPDNIIYQHHFNVNRKFKDYLKFWDQWEKQSQNEVYRMVLTCFDSIDEYLGKYKGKSGDFKADAFDKQKMIELAEHSDKFLTPKNEEILIMPALKIEITIYIFQYALLRFDIMHRKYEAEHNLKNKIEADKERHWQTFHDEVHNIKHDVSLAHTFTSIIKDKIIEKTEKILSDDIEFDVKKEYQRKLELIIKLQRDLLDKEFDDLHFYLESPKKYAYKYVKKNLECVYFIERKYSKKAKENVHSFIESLTANIKDIDKMQDDTSSPNKLRKWISSFRQNTNDIGFPEENFQILYSREDIDKCEVFEKQILDDFEILEKDLANIFNHKTKQTANFHESDPYQLALDQIWGCDEKCWFCSETCRHDLHDPKTKPHECVQHRPAGLTGWHGSGDNKMVINNCTYDVSTTDNTFFCHTVKEKKSKNCSQCSCTSPSVSEVHFYKDFKKYVDNWEIIPENVFDSSQYWMYMLCTYEKQLCEFYKNRPIK